MKRVLQEQKQQPRSWRLSFGRKKREGTRKKRWSSMVKGRPLVVGRATLCCWQSVQHAGGTVVCPLLPSRPLSYSETISKSLVCLLPLGGGGGGREFGVGHAGVTGMYKENHRVMTKR